MAENKTKATSLSVPAYIDALTDPTQRSDAKELAQLMQRASGESRNFGDRPLLASAAITTDMTVAVEETCR